MKSTPNTGLPEVVRSIRKRLGLTQTELGDRLGVSYSVVSQYERGATTPSYRVCALLLDMALPDERAPIHRTMQAESPALEREFQRAVENAQAVLERARKEMRSDPKLRDDYAIAAAQLLRMREIPPVAISLTVLMVLYADVPGADAEFSDALALLDSRLERLAPRKERERMLRKARERSGDPKLEVPAEKQPPFRVFIRCPQTKKPIDTGWTADSTRTWTAARFDTQKTHCPHCMISHEWNKGNAWLEEAS